MWLSEQKTSHFDFYQYFVQNCTDDKLQSWMSLLTLMPMEEIQEECASNRNGSAQHTLAFRVLELVRGTKAAVAARQVRIFSDFLLSLTHPSFNY